VQIVFRMLSNALTKPTLFKEPQKVCVYCHTYLWKTFTPRHTNMYIQVWMSITHLSQYQRVLEHYSATTKSVWWQEEYEHCRPTPRSVF